MNSSPSGREDTATSWAGGSVWSLVCAMELGLISEPALTSVSFATLTDDGSLVETSTPTVLMEFPSINSTIGGAAAAATASSCTTTITTTGLGLPARSSAQSPPRKKSTSSRALPKNGRGGNGRGRKTKHAATTRKSTTTVAKNVCASWDLDRELDRPRNPTVEKFWKSCKRKLSGGGGGGGGAAEKRSDRSCLDHQEDRFETDKDLFPDRARSVDLVPGIRYQTRHGGGCGGGEIAETASRSTASRRQALDRDVDHRLSRENHPVVSREPDRRKAEQESPEEETVDEDCWEFESRSMLANDPQQDLREQEEEHSYTIDEVQEEENRHEEEASPTSTSVLCDGFENDLMAIDDASTSPPESFLAMEKHSSSDWTDYLDALPLTDRIIISAAANKWRSTVGDNGKRREEDRHRRVDDKEEQRTYCRTRGRSGRTSGSSASSSTLHSVGERRPTAVRRANDSATGGGKRSNAGRKPRGRRKKSNKDDNDSQCKPPRKRKKTGAANGAAARSVKDVVAVPKTDTLLSRLPRWGDCHEIRRVTRGVTRLSKMNFLGKLVWGFCSGWWPALIIDESHVGMSTDAGKLWVYWIGEARVSLLLERTQIEPFTASMEQRLLSTSMARSRAVDATMQLLRNYLGCTLTKPYVRWIETNFGGMFNTFDEPRFYPFPVRIENILADLKSETDQSDQKEESPKDQKRENQPRKTTEKPKESTQQSAADLTRLPLGEQIPGVITWAKIAGHNWWPAMIIDYRDCCMREPSFGCQWIMWYGDYKLSEIHHQAFMRFDMGMEKMRDYIKNTKKHAFVDGVLQASKDYCARMEYDTDNWTLATMFEYFSKINEPQPQPKPLRKSDSAKIYDKYSPHIVKELNEMKNNPNVDDQRVNDIEKSDDLRYVKSRQASMESLCLKCLKIPDGPMECHPFFEGSLCIQCSEQYKPCMFVFGNDAKCFYCTICAATGMVIICDNEDCPRVYCTACMKHLLCPTTYEQVLLEDPWECFLCKARSGTVTDTIVRPRSNWKDKIIDMFRTSCNPSARFSGQYVSEYVGEPRKIRVLSLFDGLSTGLLVLRKLGLTVDVYYASEIDPDALMVSATHFGDSIIHLGDVRRITKEKIKEIAPIDLLIGGSPCNDLSLANPARLGLYDPRGTGILFFEYCRILKLLKRLNHRHHLFWLFENVASMPSEYRLAMNEHLGQEPDVIDSADFSPQHRLRLYWHNLPFEVHSLPSQDEQDVQDILTPHCQRYALVKKIRTVTTKVNSLKQGKSALKPILMKDESDSLWITELEEIFGFPRHYTDVKNLSATKRQRLIGKSWSVQTLTAIFKSLCPYFECNIAEMNTALRS